MKNPKSLYHGHRFPAAVISCAVRWYFRFQLSLRDIEELLFERGVIVSYETIRRWCDKFGTGFAHRVKAARRKPGSTWHLDEVFVTLRGEPYLLWRPVDQHGAKLNILLQKRRDKAAAKRLFKHVLASCAEAPRKIATDQLRTYPGESRDSRTDSCRARLRQSQRAAEQQGRTQSSTDARTRATHAWLPRSLNARRLSYRASVRSDSISHSKRHLLRSLYRKQLAA